VTSGELARGPYSSYVTTLVNAAIVAAEEKIGVDTVVLDLRELVDSFDALVVTSGRNDRQVRALAEEIERLVDLALDVKPIHVEGLTQGEWVALDYGDVIVHVFDESAREYYDLEHLWSAAPALRPLATRWA
jgi:ribosome-associated protein